MSPSSIAETVLPEITPDIPNKPGYETSEFWITLVSTMVPNLITILAISKLVPTEIASTLSTALVSVLSGVITIVVALKYIKSRTEIKTKAMDLNNSIKALNFQQQTTRTQLCIQLMDKGIIDKEAVKKQFNIQ